MAQGGDSGRGTGGERDPLAPFDEARIRRVASEADLAVEAVREALRRHQEQMRELPGAENLVYEWRKLLPRDPLVERRADAYLLEVHPDVWPQFADALDLSGAALEAVKAVHARQVRAGTEDAGDTDGVEPGRPADWEALVVTRE